MYVILGASLVCVDVEEGTAVEGARQQLLPHHENIHSYIGNAVIISIQGSDPAHEWICEGGIALHLQRYSLLTAKIPNPGIKFLIAPYTKPVDNFHQSIVATDAQSWSVNGCVRWVLVVC